MPLAKPLMRSNRARAVVPVPKPARPTPASQLVARSTGDVYVAPHANLNPWGQATNIPQHRLELWERVASTQFRQRVGSFKVKTLAVMQTAALALATGGVILFITLLPPGAGFTALVMLAVANGVLGLVSLNSLWTAFHHDHPAKPSSLRRHSFYLTGIVPKKAQARRAVKWLGEQGFIAEKRDARQVLRNVTGAELMRRGMAQSLPFLDVNRVEQIADTLNFVRVCASAPAMAAVAAAPGPNWAITRG